MRLLLVALALWSSLAAAQTRIRIVSAKNKKPVKGAFVRVFPAAAPDQISCAEAPGLPVDGTTEVKADKKGQVVLPSASEGFFELVAPKHVIVRRTSLVSGTVYALIPEKGAKVPTAEKALATARSNAFWAASGVEAKACPSDDGQWVLGPAPEPGKVLPARLATVDGVKGTLQFHACPREATQLAKKRADATRIVYEDQATGNLFDCALPAEADCAIDNLIVAEDARPADICGNVGASVRLLTRGGGNARCELGACRRVAK